MGTDEKVVHYARAVTTRQTVLDVSDFSPRLIVSYLYLPRPSTPRGKRLEYRIVTDFELELILESDGFQIIDGVKYQIKPGDVVFRRPGQQTQGIMPYSCYCVIFDLEGKKRPNRDPYWSGRERPLQPDFQSGFLEAIGPVNHPPSDAVYRHLFETALKHYATPGVGSELIHKSCLLQLLYHLHNDVRDPIVRAGDPASSGGNMARVRQALAYMRLNFKKRMNLSDLASIAELSPTYFHQVFSRTMGISPLDHLTRLRMDYAKELLATTEMPGNAIALNCGFSNVPYFFTRFRKLNGETPEAFRSRHRFPFSG